MELYKEFCKVINPLPDDFVEYSWADIESSRNVHETDAHNSSFLCTKVKRICQVCRPFLSQDYFKRRKKVVCQNCGQTGSFIVNPFEWEKVT